MSSTLLSQTNSQELVVYRSGNLLVEVDKDPIGGYRGKAGALKIEHIEHKFLTKWNADDLNRLAEVIQKILGIYNQANIQNVLIFAKQEEHQFKFCLIPYPKCNWIEKIEGLVHVIFGGKALSLKQKSEIASFYQCKFLSETPSKDVPCARSGRDVFCNPSLIQRQLIANISMENKTYHLLYHNRPKGRTSEDPHLLVIPKGEEGHCHKANQLTKQRFHMLLIIQKALDVLLKEGNKTVLYLERNGGKLQGVLHKHAHAIGIRSFPQTFFEKIKALLRLLWPASLPAHVLKERVHHYKAYN